MLIAAGADEACTTSDCEASAMVQRINRKQTASPLTQLLQATTKMLRDGSTPAVLVFTGDTLKEIEDDIIPKIDANHDADQKLLDDQIKELEAIITTFNGEVIKLETFSKTEETDDTNHKSCRGVDLVTKDGKAIGDSADSEVKLCIDASKKNWIRAEAWAKLLSGERTYTQISTTIHGRFCPPRAVTWHSKDLTDEEINPMVAQLQEYRSTTVTKMMKFNTDGAKYFRVLIPAWILTDNTAQSANQSHMNKKTTCEGLKTVLETSSCTRAQHHATFLHNFRVEWTSAEEIFNETKLNIVSAEKDRIREVVTLGMVQCLLKKIESKNGTACKTTGEADEEIQDCETKNITTTRWEIDYPCAPDQPVPPIIKVFPGQPTHYWTYRYSTIESHGFCFTDEAGKVDKVNNQFPMKVIFNKDSCPLGTVDPNHLEFPLPEV